MIDAGGHAGKRPFVGTLRLIPGALSPCRRALVLGVGNRRSPHHRSYSLQNNSTLVAFEAKCGLPLGDKYLFFHVLDIFLDIWLDTVLRCLRI